MTNLAIAFAAINAVTYMLYWYDKSCAKKGGWRVAESALLLSALLGGSPAAFLAMRQFRHKTKKRGFRIRYWLIVAAQVVGALWWVSQR